MCLKASKQVKALFLFTGLMVLASCNQAGQETLKGSRPNIIFILADDMGWADLPLYGNQFNEAPNLTRMAEEGLRFTDAYAACPVPNPGFIPEARYEWGKHPDQN